MFSTIGLILVAGTDEIGDRQETRATEPMLKAARYSRLPAGSPITKNDHMCLIDGVGGVAGRSGSVALGVSTGLALQVPGIRGVSW